MRINIGLDDYALRQKNEHRQVIWDSQRVINPHMLICGGSGTGKTYTIRRILQAAANSPTPPRIHIFDVHGDLRLEGASSVRFSEASEHGFNPLLLNPDPHFGGVRRKVQGLISALDRTSRALGPKQEAALRNLLLDVYAANGYYAERPDTWRMTPGRKVPSIGDVLRFARAKLKQLYLGADTATVAALEAVNKAMRQHQAAAKRALSAAKAADTEGADKANSQIEVLAGKAIEAFSKHLETLKTGREFEDILKYDSMDVLKGVVDRLENLESIGIFKPTVPPFDPAARIWHYDITALQADEAKLFVWFRLEAIFNMAVQRGEQDDVRDIIVVDEAHRYASTQASDTTNPLETIALEARKFGVALMGISQSPHHFPEDFLGNVATKLLLGIDEMYWEQSVRKLNITKDTLKFVKPRETLAAQIKSTGSTRNTFQQVVVGGHALARSVA